MRSENRPNASGSTVGSGDRPGSLRLVEPARAGGYCAPRPAAPVWSVTRSTEGS